MNFQKAAALLLSLGMATIAMASQEALGWKKDACHTCGGSFEEYPFLFTLPEKNSNPEKNQIWAQQVHTEGTQHLMLRDHVSIWNAPDWMQGQQLWLKTNAEHQLEQVRWKLGLWFHPPGFWLKSQTANIFPQKHIGLLNDVNYRLQVHHDSFYAHGYAEYAEQINAETYRLHRANYSTCSPDARTWQLNTRALELNSAQGWGRAWHGVMYWRGVPVFYVPVFDFPLDERRKSGFLWPSLANTSEDGFIFSAPYYFNAAPNYDLTFTPTWISQRGWLLEPQGRYLFPQHQGNMHFSLLPSDRAFSDFKMHAAERYPQAPELLTVQQAHSSRRTYSWQHQWTLSPEASFNINYNEASDDQILEDLHRDLVQHTGVVLPQHIQWSWNTPYWSHALSWHRDRILHPLNQPNFYTPYRHWPEYIGQGQWPHNPFEPGTHVSLGTQWARLVRGVRAEDAGNSPPSSAHRLHLQPEWSYRFERSYGYFRPRAALFLTNYEIERTLQPQHIQRAIPALSAEGGLFWEALTSSYAHTMEPKIQFKWVPYRTQDAIPLFDGAQTANSYEGLFRLNRYSSIDRIGDARQSIVGLSGSSIERNSQMERWYWAVAQEFNFIVPRVSSCSTPGCLTTDALLPQQKGLYLGYSLAEIHWTPTQPWTLLLQTTWDNQNKVIDQAQAWVQYFLSTHHILNLGYGYLRNGDSSNVLNTADSANHLRQLHASLSWPLVYEWQAYASLRHSFNRHTTQDMLYGVSHEGCCYTLNLGMGRFAKGYESPEHPLFRKMVYVQLVLHGLGAVGSNQFAPLLTQWIPQGETSH